MSAISNQYDHLFKHYVARHFPSLYAEFGDSAWLWIKAQAWQESRLQASAVSPAGASGIMQLMPLTAADLGVKRLFEPEENIRAGVEYLSKQYLRLSEIPHATDRLKAAFAAYNGGRAYVNKAMALGRVAEGHPESYRAWLESGEPRGAWQTWPVIAFNLTSSECMSAGLRPDHVQMIDYVQKIETFYIHLIMKGQKL
jgi:membrane-bound lytic murein transglycosylase MltF